MGLLGSSSGGPTVGLDIGTNLIKVVEAKPGKDGIQLTAVSIGPTPPGTIDNEIVVDPQALGRSIRTLLAESGITSKKCISSISGQSSVIVRIIEVPKMTLQELAETMKWEVERHVPFAADEVVMDFLPVEREDADPADQNMEVLLAVAQQDVINSHIETLLAAGLEPQAIDVETLAVSRSLIDIAKNGLSNQTVAIISIGASITEFGVYKDSMLAFPRTLPLAGDYLTQTISENLRISRELAERLKKEKGVVLLDKAATAMAEGTDTGFNSIQESEETQEEAETPEAQQSDQFGFLPGIGFIGAENEGEGKGEGESESEGEQTSAQQPPEFDVNIPQPEDKEPETALDFDLESDEEVGRAPRQAFDLSAVDDESAESTDAAPAAMDLSVLSSLTDVNEREDFSQEEIFNAMWPALNDLIVEIRRSLEYFSSRFQNQPDKILLCGGTAKLTDLDKLIEAELGIPVVIANPLQNVTLFSEGMSDDYLEEVASVLPVSIGLAIRDMIGE